MSTFLSAALPKFSLILLIIKKPSVLIPIVPAVIATNVIVSFESLGYLLLWVFLFDLGSGVLASYFDWRKSDHKDRWFFGTGGKDEGFSSDKAKKMFVKAIVYISLPLLLIKLQQTLFLKNFKYTRLSDAEFEWATIAVITFLLIELFSIFFENLPRCGFNICSIVKKMFGVYKTARKELKEE